MSKLPKGYSKPQISSNDESYESNIMGIFWLLRSINLYENHDKGKILNYSVVVLSMIIVLGIRDFTKCDWWT